MGKKNGINDKPTTTPENQNITLREENIGRKHINISSMLKLEHLQKLAIWATGETLIPSLGALYGQRLAASAELAGVPLERALFICQRCETVLQPGDNCTIRIESLHDRSKRRKKLRHRQNNIVYTCHFCSNRNLIKGSARGCVKELLGSRTKRFSAINEASKEDTAVQAQVHANATENPKTPGTPFTPRSLLSGKKTSLGIKSCNSNNSRKDTADLGIAKVSGGSSKRKRRRGSSLRDIVENNENSNRVNISNLVIPLKL